MSLWVTGFLSPFIWWVFLTMKMDLVLTFQSSWPTNTLTRLCSHGRIYEYKMAEAQISTEATGDDSNQRASSKCPDSIRDGLKGLLRSNKTLSPVPFSLLLLIAAIPSCGGETVLQSKTTSSGVFTFRSDGANTHTLRMEVEHWFNEHIMQNYDIGPDGAKRPFFSSSGPKTKIWKWP